jgi:hypothetical protein
MTTVTQWFNKDQKPSRVGVYEVDDADCRGESVKWFAYWNGDKFGYRTFDAPDALILRKEPTALPRLTQWRGLAVKP